MNIFRKIYNCIFDSRPTYIGYNDHKITLDERDSLKKQLAVKERDLIMADENLESLRRLINKQKDQLKMALEEIERLKSSKKE